MMRAILSQPTDVMITAVAGDTAQGRVTGGGRYALGESCTLTAIPSGDNVFDHWNDGNTDNPRTFTATTNANYTAIFSGCAVNSLPLTQDFSNDLGCWTTYSASTENAADMGIYSSSSWWGTVAYFKFCSQRLDYNYDQYLISPRLSVPNVIDLTLSYSCYSNTTETFQIVYSTTSNNPASFTHVLRSGTCSISTWDTMHVVVPSEATYVAIHYTTQHGYYLYIDDIQMEGQPLPSHNVTVVSESTLMGSVTGSGSYTEGSHATITATSNPCYEFLHWQDGNTQNPRSIVVNEDVTYTASFEPVSFVGIEEVSGCDSAYWHETWYYESTSSESYNTTTAQGCDSVVTLVLTLHHSTLYDTIIYSNGAIEIDDIIYTQDDTILRQFTNQYGCDSIIRVILNIGNIQYTISVEPSDSSHGNVTGGGTYSEGEWVVLTAIQTPGYAFSHWSDGMTENPYRFQAVQDISLTAFFTSCQGIEQILQQVLIMQQNRVLNIIGADGKRIVVCDIQGRKVASTDRASSQWQTILPASGIYLIKVEDIPTRKVIVK